MGRYDTLLEPSKPPAPKTVPPSLMQETPPEGQTTHVHANLQAGKDASMQTSKPVNLQAGKDASVQASKPVNLQTRKPANIQTGSSVMVEKYSTYLTPICKRGLKRIAFESDRKDYEVLIEAVEQYLESNKQPH